MQCFQDGKIVINLNTKGEIMKRKEFLRKTGMYLGLSALGVGVISDLLANTSKLKLFSKYIFYDPKTFLPTDRYVYMDKFHKIINKNVPVKVYYPYFVKCYNPKDFTSIYYLVDKKNNKTIIKSLNNKEYEKYKRRGECY